ncbi:DUF5977 domain-containing protein [Sphingobacterium detergens]|uniref:DUF5977 domain-containing protein n=1 Tax=Sphingobacterium detergens TaxID=1145106 RepID=UPI003AAD33B1
MAEEIKIEAINTFEGGQNTDIADELIPPNQVRYYFNCLILSSGDGQYGIVRNLKGTEMVRTPLQEGENKCIGTANDEKNKKFYFAVWNSNGYHSWMMYSEVDRSVVKVMECRTDTRDNIIWDWKKTDKITHADVDQGNLLYWVLNGAWKINIKKAMDKSDSGYGDEILEEYTRAYKQTSAFAPKAAYSTNPNIANNLLYGAQFKFGQRFSYDDYEKSNYSDFSNVPIPDKEANQGINSVSYDNNCIDVTVETGNRLVTDIEVIMQKTMPDGSFSDWYQIAVLNKKELGLGDNSTYVYKFYNDGTYINVDQNKVARPHNFMPKYPKCQMLVRNAIIYSNSPEGFEWLSPDVKLEVEYKEIFDDTSYETEFNNPFIGMSVEEWKETKGGVFGAFRDIWWHSVVTITIGPDVKKGNKFVINAPSAYTQPYFEVLASAIDDSISIANKFVNMIMAADRFKIVNYVSGAGGGAAKFTFDYTHQEGKSSKPFYVDKVPVLYSSLKDYGQNVRSFKLGSSRSFAVRYYDDDGRKSNYYISEDMTVKFDPINSFQEPKLAVVVANIHHRPPVWAKYWELLIGPDLTYNNGNFIQVLIQKVVEFKFTNNVSNGETYLNLHVGSLFMFQRIHPNTTLKYEFKKGDRLRLIKKIDVNQLDFPETYYEFFETEIIEYSDEIIETIDDVIRTNGTSFVETSTVDEGNKGLIIEIDGVERTINAVQSNGYDLDRPMTKTESYPNFRIINRNGVIRIKRPNTPSIIDFSVVEIFTPSLNAESLGQYAFYEFGHKYPIIDWGTENRMHGGNFQQQTDNVPAIVKVSNGTSYIRKRELPINNAKRNASVMISTVEDPSFSDYYASAMYDLGRPVPKDDKSGVVEFVNRCRYSNNRIEDTRINGLNDFDNLDRVDYNDNYGAIWLTVYGEERAYIFKELKSGWSPIYGRVIMDQSGQNQLAIHDKILSPNLQYYSFDGGIGTYASAYVKNENNHYFMSPGTLSICRVGGDGVDPISEIYNIDSECRDKLSSATRSNGMINMGYDRANRSVLVGIEDYDNLIYNEPFSENAWQIYDPISEEPSDYEIVSGPSHGTASIVDGDIFYESDSGYVGPDSLTCRVKINGEWSQPILFHLIVGAVDHRVFANQEQKAVFYKQCPGGRGSAVEYVVPAGKYESGTSLQDANNQAIIEIQANGQNYANEHGTCVYVNARQSRNFQKNNCANDGEGSTVTMVAEEGDFTSVISEADANTKAVNYLNLNGQAYANANGTCLWKNDQKQGTYYKTDCADGTSPEPYTYTVIAGKYSSTISKQEANDLAEEDLTINGQLAANMNGVCTLLVNIRYSHWESAGNTSSNFASSKQIKINDVQYSLDFDTVNAIGKYIGFREPIGCPAKTKWQLSGGTKENISGVFTVVEENGYRYYFSEDPFFVTEVKTLTLSVN